VQRRKAAESCIDFSCVLNAICSGPIRKKKLHFCVYQTIIWLWLVQKQKQPRKQTGSTYKKKPFLMGSAVRKEPTAMGYFQ
jgi:hypothetical protein